MTQTDLRGSQSEIGERPVLAVLEFATKQWGWPLPQASWEAVATALALAIKYTEN